MRFRRPLTCLNARLIASGLSEATKRTGLSGRSQRGSVARAEGLEPPTNGFGDTRNRSYRPAQSGDGKPGCRSHASNWGTNWGTPVTRPAGSTVATGGTPKPPRTSRGGSILDRPQAGIGTGTRRWKHKVLSDLSAPQDFLRVDPHRKQSALSAVRPVRTSPQVPVLHLPGSHHNSQKQ